MATTPGAGNANRKYDTDPELFFQLDKAVEGDMTRNCSRKDLDWMLGKCFFF